MDLQKLPIGEQSFEKLRSENRLYVDKTAYIYRMTQDGTYYVLSRPRRFGKSLLLSTIEAYFLGKRELFDGLYIGQVEQEWTVHPVLHLDLNPQSYSAEHDLENVLDDFLCVQELIYGAKEWETSVSLRFKGLIQRAYEQTGQSVVVLIDEYDKPLIQTIDNIELQEKFRSTLRGFYSVLKSMNKYLRFVLLTGITKFSKLSIFSDLNNLNDVSRDRMYASICGLTDEEVDRDLTAHISQFAEQSGKSYEFIREAIRKKYDGYHFVGDCQGLYNPYSLMCALAKQNLGSYWFETGTPTMLVKILQRKHYQLPDLENPIDTSALDNRDGNYDSIVPLLYQSGYLSIKQMGANGRYCWLKFPNEEVRDGFFDFLLPYYTSVKKDETAFEIDSFVNDVRNGHADQFLQRLQSFFADFRYDAQTTPEAHFRNVLYILCKLIGLQVDAEYMTSDGRIDLLIRTDEYVYIIECKIDSSARVALEQIKAKEYALPWAVDNRAKVMIGLNFSTKSRRPEEWLIEADGEVSGDIIGTQVRKYASTQVSTQVRKYASTQVCKLVLGIGRDTCKMTELQDRLGIRTREYIRKQMIVPAINDGYVAKLYAANNSSNQAYYLTEKGLQLLASIVDAN